MRTFAISVVLVALCLGAYYFISGYRSAFEADQACHAEKWNAYGEKSGFGCDHDLETNQWLLYEAFSDHQPSKVIKRYSY